MTNMICGVFGPFMRLVMTSIQHSIQSINNKQDPTQWEGTALFDPQILVRSTELKGLY